MYFTIKVWLSYETKKKKWGFFSSFCWKFQLEIKRFWLPLTLFTLFDDDFFVLLLWMNDLKSQLKHIHKHSPNKIDLWIPFDHYIRIRKDVRENTVFHVTISGSTVSVYTLSPITLHYIITLEQYFTFFDKNSKGFSTLCRRTVLSDSVYL